jgi:hypothetical protein
MPAFNDIIVVILIKIFQRQQIFLTDYQYVLFVVKKIFQIVFDAFLQCSALTQEIFCHITSSSILNSDLSISTTNP